MTTKNMFLIPSDILKSLDKSYPEPSTIFKDSSYVVMGYNIPSLLGIGYDYNEM